MQTRCLAITAILSILLLTFGCSGSPYRETALDKSWGRSLEATQFAQMIDPDAGKDPAPVEGLDGRASETNVFKYLKSFEKDSNRPLRYESTAGGKVSN